MKTFKYISFIAMGISMQAYAQTNRINHYSHSGNNATLSIFKANDNMGLNCGSPYNKEYSPDTTNNLTIHDSVFLDTTKPKVCKPTGAKSIENPRRGLSLERTFDAEEVLGKF